NFLGVDAIELLVDRRPYLPADANLNGIVDVTDFSILASNFNQSGLLWAQGDFTLNGSVDLADFSILAANFNRTLNNPLPRAVPEPSTAALATAGALLLGRRPANRRSSPTGCP
ncbi:MAG: hypothetical protein NZ561_12585, partial [Phycisphaerae bacterium]|nr:hypothetical protein [Phycisphaerae bacterium]MDW8263013.1 hypothetical protein [Phycisphaerales bacterium]